MKIQFDAKKCTGCSACVIACIDQRDIDCASGQKPLRYMKKEEKSGHLIWHSVGCIQCGACIPACPRGAIRREADGVILIDAKSCMGCGTCEKVCPRGVISIRPADHKAMKCDLCRGRIAAGLLPACVHTCPAGSLLLK